MDDMKKMGIKLPYFFFVIIFYQVNKMMDDMKKMGIKPPY